MVRILLADDHDIVRQGLRDILEPRRDWEVVSEAINGQEAVEKASETLPDVAILDYSMPCMNGIEAARQIRERAPRTEVLIFTMYDSESIVDEVRRAGVRGYVLKSEAQSQLARAIECVARGKEFFNGQASPTRAAPSSERKPLTPRERSVLQLVADGCTNKQIARRLGISLQTVQTYRISLRSKLDLRTTAALVRYAIRHGIA